jgi:hypothetical protein
MDPSPGKKRRDSGLPKKALKAMLHLTLSAWPATLRPSALKLCLFFDLLK